MFKKIKNWIKIEVLTKPMVKKLNFIKKKKNGGNPLKQINNSCNTQLCLVYNLIKLKILNKFTWVKCLFMLYTEKK